MNDVSPENLLKQIEIYLNKRNYREAYSVWERLKALQDEGTLISADLTELFRTLNRGAQNQRQTLVTQLEATFAPGVDILQRDLGFETQSALDALYGASLPDDEYDYRRLKARFETLKTEQQHRREYENTRAIVEGHWLEAERVASADRSIGVDSLMVHYNQALAVASEAFENSPQNKLLEQLALEAKKQRERFAGEEEIMTSGGQTDDFVRVLKHVNSLKDGESVMVYDNTGAPTSRMKREDARAEVIKNAKVYVAQKATVYAQEVTDALNTNNPREAKSWLERYQKFIALDEFAAGENILTGRQRDTYSQLQRQVNDAIVQLEDAEKAAERAAVESEQDAFRAWPIYVGALRQYAGTARSTVVKQAAERITAATRSQVHQRLAVIDTQIQTFDYQDALKGANTLAELFEMAWGALNNTEGLVEGARAILQQAVATLTAERAAIENTRKAAEKGINDKAAINKSLVEINKLSANEPQKAKDELDALINKYGAPLVQTDSQYSDVNSRVKTVVDAAGLLEEFSTYLSSESLHDVHKKQEEAVAAAKRASDADYKRRFGEVAEQLGFKARLLEAEALLTKEGYGKTIDVYKAVRNEQNLGATVREYVTTRLKQLEIKKSQAENNKDALNEADLALSNGKFEAVWKHLAKVERFSDEEQSQHWLKMLRSSADLISVETPFDLTLYKAVLALARNFSTQVADSFAKQTRKYVQAQNARDAERASDVDEALRLWQEGLDNGLVGGEDADYFVEQVNGLQKRIMLKHQEDWMRDLVNPAREMNNVMAAIQTFLSELRVRAASASNTSDKLEYAIWVAEAELAYAVNHPDPATRHTTLDTLGQQADLIERTIREYENNAPRSQTRVMRPNATVALDKNLLSDARKKLKLVKTAHRVSTVLRDVELNVLTPKETVDLSQFESAIANWNKLFEDAELADGYRTLIDWYNRETSTLRSTLAAKLNAAKKTDIQYLASGARLLTLDPNDLDGQKMVSSFKDLDAILNREFEKLINSLPNTPEVSGYQQLEQLNQWIAYFDLLELVLRRPFAQKADGENAALESLVNKQRNLANAVVDAFKRFQNFVKRFEDAIRDSRGNSDDWEQTEKRLQERYQKLKDDVKSIGNELAKLLRPENNINADRFDRLHLDHHDMKEAEEKLTKTARSVEEVAEVCRKVKAYAEEDRFEDALRTILNTESRISREMSFADMWNGSDVPKNLIIQASEDNHTEHGWNNIKKFVQDRSERLKRVLKWAQGLGKRIGWDNISDETLAIAYDQQPDEAHNMLIALYERQDFSQAVKFQVEALIAEGRFNYAETLLKTVLDGGEALGGYESLSTTESHFTNYPLANSENDSTKDLKEALNVAGSKAARSVLEDAVEAIKDKQRAYTEARAMRDVTLKERKNRWEMLTKDAISQLNTIAAFNEKHHRGVRGRDVNELRTLYQRYQQHIDQMRKDFPYHWEIDRYQQHPEINRARKMLPPQNA